MLSSRYVKFVNSMLMSSKPEVAFLANLSVDDHRTVMGRTMARLKKELDVQVITKGLARKKIKYFPVPRLEEWRLSFLDELLAIDTGEFMIEGDLSSADLKAMISSLCTS